MAFQIKDFVSIVVSMVNHMKATQSKITDFNVGSVARTLVEAPAQEIEQLYIQIFNGLRESIPTAVFRSFQFDALVARPASGTVTLTADPDAEFPISIPAGTVIKVAGSPVKYLTARDVSLDFVEQTASVRVLADRPGVIGNTGAFTANQLDFPIQGVASVFNRLPISGGAEDETDDERLLRFKEFIRSISRGTVASLKFAAASASVLTDTGEVVEAVERVGVDEGAGRVTVFIYGTSGLPSADLLRAAQRLIDGYVNDNGEEVPGYRSGGIRADVVAMSERALSFTVSVEMLPGSVLGATERDAIGREIASVLLQTSPGEVLYVDELDAAALRVNGVRRAFVSLSENVVCEQNQVLVLGDLNVAGL